MNTRYLNILILLGAVGCSHQLPPLASPDRAQAALQEALDAWRKGETVESLQGRVPAIHVNDPDWRGNKHLVNFQIGSGQTHGQSWRCEVLLTLQESAANARQQKVRYIIDTDPTLVVVRD